MKNVHTQHINFYLVSISLILLKIAEKLEHRLFIMQWSGILSNAERNRKGFTIDQVLQPNRILRASHSITTPSNKGVVIKLMIICSSYPPS